jgi:hypothetical protein
MPILDQDFLSLVQRRLAEEPNAGQSFFSEHWTHEELIRSTHDRQDALLAATHLQIGVCRLPETAGASVYVLPDDWIATVAVVRYPLTGHPYLLDLGDSYELDHGDRTWPAAVTRPVLSFDREPGTHHLHIAPASDTGNPGDLTSSYLLVYYVPRAAKITGEGEMLTIPDEVAIPVLQYGILADLLGKVGRGQDVGRAQYCRQRWELGIEATRLIVEGLA